MLIAKKTVLAAAAAVMLNLSGCGGGGSGGGTDALAPSKPVLPADSTAPADTSLSTAAPTLMDSSASTTPAAPTDSSAPGTTAVSPGTSASATPTTPSPSTPPSTSTAPASETSASTSGQLGAITSAQLSGFTSADIRPLDPSTSPLPPITIPDLSLGIVGAMVDGYVAGATVYCDKNGNGVGDAEESSATTDANGNYTLHNCSSAVVGSGGTDTATGFPFTGVLRTPPLSGFMTPLTTLVTGTGLSTAQLNRLLALPEGTDPTRMDPTQNFALFKATLAVQQVMAQLAATIQAAAGGDLGAIYARVASSLANTLKYAPAGTALISGSGLNVDLLASAARAAAGAGTFSAADLTALVADIKGQSEAFLAASSMDSLLSLTKILQNPSLRIDPHAGTRYFALHDDAVLFGGHPCTLADLSSPGGVTLTSFDKIGLRVDVSGVPAVGTSGVALSLVELGGSGRALKLMLDKVSFKLANAQLSMVVAPDAKVYLYGRKANGTTLSLSGPLGALQKPVAVLDNTLTLDYSAIVKRLMESASSANTPSLQSFLGVSGTFQITAAISNFNLRKANAGALAQTVVTIDDTGGRLGGVGFTGKVTVLGH